jgi:hypothetical protein
MRNYNLMLIMHNKTIFFLSNNAIARTLLLRPLLYGLNRLDFGIICGHLHFVSLGLL